MWFVWRRFSQPAEPGIVKIATLHDERTPVIDEDPVTAPPSLGVADVHLAGPDGLGDVVRLPGQPRDTHEREECCER